MLAVAFQRTIVLLPWLDGPDDFRASLPNELGRVHVHGDLIPWPAEAEFVLDF